MSEEADRRERSDQSTISSRFEVSINVRSTPTPLASPNDMHRKQSVSWPQLVLRVTGAGLLIATGSIHLDLYLTGYRTIPTIGWLFLLQLIAAFGLGAIVLAFPSRLVSAAGAGFAIATLGGYLLSLRIGLFGFREVRTTAGIAAGVIEVTTFIALAAFVLSSRAERRFRLRRHCRNEAGLVEFRHQ